MSLISATKAASEARVSVNKALAPSTSDRIKELLTTGHNMLARIKHLSSLST
ncbi:MAG: hypothetical protein ACOC7M_02320 [Chloroflexota bacterium]